jgi:hypothetical protein
LVVGYERSSAAATQWSAVADFSLIIGGGAIVTAYFYSGFAHK